LGYLRVFLAVVLFWAFIAINYYPPAYVKAPSSGSDNTLPNIKDPNFKAELVVKGLTHPTSMAFLGPNDILVLEKDSGKVKRIINGTMLKEPLLDVNVSNKDERGMLGIAVAPKHDNNNISMSSSIILNLAVEEMAMIVLLVGSH
jgi:aldose sugar dehydrogenase